MILNRLKQITSLNPTYILEDECLMPSGTKPNEIKNAIREKVEFILPLLIQNMCDIHKMTRTELDKRYENHGGVNNILLNSALRSYSKKNEELTGQHFCAIKRFLKSQYEYALILEDDSLPFVSNEHIFAKAITTILSEINNEYPAFIDISDSLQLKCQIKAQSKTLLQRVANGRTRCSSSYIINRKAAIKLMPNQACLLTN